MSVPALVSDPSQVTADWLTAVLAHAGELSGGAVAGFEVAAIGTGSVGSTLRYRLRYRAGSAAGRNLWASGTIPSLSSMVNTTNSISLK